VLAVGADDLPLGFTDGAVVDQTIETVFFPFLTDATVHNTSPDRGIREMAIVEGSFCIQRLPVNYKSSVCTSPASEAFASNFVLKLLHMPYACLYLKENADMKVEPSSVGGSQNFR
jgi:hypothetical protein